MEDKNREYFQEMIREIEIKNDIAQKILDNRLTVIRTPEEKEEMNLQYKEYEKESQRILKFCERMMKKEERGVDYLELEQPQGVPKVKAISKEKLDEKLR